MVINKRSRSELKSYFKKDALPTERQFADLIDGMLNQKDDGVVKVPGAALCVEAATDAAGAKHALSLYGSLADSAPEWTLGLRCSATAGDGLSIADGSGAVRLFIDRAAGNVGVGTVEPAARLHVAGGAIIDGDLTVNGKLDVQRAPGEDWKELPLSPGWQPYGDGYTLPEYCKDATGVVHLRGVIKGTNSAKAKPCASLPEGCRPKWRTLHTVLADDRLNRIDVTVEGQVLLVYTAGCADYLSLHGVAFQARP